MKGSSIIKPGRPSSTRTKNRAAAKPSLDRLFDEVGGAMDAAMELAGRDALVEHARAGRDVPVWIDGKVMHKPAAQLLAEFDAEKSANPARNARPRARRS